MPDGLLYVISGILAGGIPGFRIVLCCFTHSMVWQCDVCVCVFSFVLFPAIPIPELIQCYHLTFFTSFWTGLPITFQVACLLVWVGCLACLCFGFGFVAFCVVVFFVLFFAMDCDGC